MLATRASRFAAGMAVLLLTAGIGWLDWLTGPEWGFHLFYLMPVTWAGWWLGRRYAVVSGLAAGIAWFLADWSAGHTLISAWNGGTKAIIFIGVGVLTAYLRRDRDQLVASHAKVRELLAREEQLARVDPLTGVANVRAFLEHLTLRATQVRRSGVPLCVGYLDLDNFKRVNDRYGHPRGDQVLRDVAQALRSTFREVDFPARIGGDEFAVVFHDIDPAEAERVGTRLLEKVSELAKGCPEAALGVSVGIAVIDVPAEDVEAILRLPDQVMYQAKTAGKGRVLVRRFAP
jgi:diguanylate cyclase (GGDEF)-like protein